MTNYTDYNPRKVWRELLAEFEVNWYVETEYLLQMLADNLSRKIGENEAEKYIKHLRTKMKGILNDFQRS